MRHISLSVDGAAVGQWTGVPGEPTLTADVVVAGASSLALQLDLAPGDVGWSERGLESGSPTV